MHFRKFLQEQLTAIERLLQSGDLPPNIISAYTAIRDQFKGALAALPADEGAAVDPTVVNSVLAGFGASLATLNGAVGAITAAVNTQWQARVDGGELVTKDRHSKLCAEATEAARSAGSAEGKKAAEVEYGQKLALERRGVERAQVIARNGLPPAPEAILALDDPQFAEAEKVARARLQEITAASIDPKLRFVGTYAWANSGEAEVMGEFLKQGRPAINPLAGGGGAGTAGGDGNGSGAPRLSFAL